MSHHITPMLPSHITGILAVQHACFPPDLRESAEVFANRIARFPTFNRTALHESEIIAYMLCFPWKLGDTPINNQPFPPTLPTPDCFYIHDIAVHPNARGSRLADTLIKTAFHTARTHGFAQLSLTAVAQSGDYWDRRGFTPYTRLSPQKASQITMIYGKGARLMICNTFTPK